MWLTKIFSRRPPKITWYIYGRRPVIEEAYKDYSTFYAFNWETGEFEEDMTYAFKIWDDQSGDAEKVIKDEFDKYVQELREKRGLL